MIKKANFVSCSRMPQLFTKDIALVQQFFESMCKVGDRPQYKRKGCIIALSMSLQASVA